MAKKTNITIGFIGAGNMGAAIIAGIFKEYKILVNDVDKKKVSVLKKKYKVLSRDFDALIEEADVIILAIKPQSFEEVLKSIKPLTNKNKLFISIAAGITTKYIQKALGKDARVVRAMPNLPVTVSEGMTGLCLGKSAKNTDLILSCRIFNSIGQAVVVKEKLMDAVTAVSGSGPAYVFYFVEAMNKAARKLGLQEELADQFVLQTLKGGIAMLESTSETPESLRKKVTSRKGTTEAALKVMMKKDLDKIIFEGMKAAKVRSKELSKD